MQWKAVSNEGNFIDNIAVHPYSIQRTANKIVLCILPNKY